MYVVERGIAMSRTPRALIHGKLAKSFLHMAGLRKGTKECLTVYKQLTSMFKD